MFRKNMIVFLTITSMILISAILFSGCTKDTEPEKMKKSENNLAVKLSFKKFPEKYTCDGEDISPQIIIENAEGKSIAIIMDDPDAPLRTFTHWLIWNIPVTEEIPENIPKSGIVESIKAVQGRNDFGNIGYSGPCPPEGSKHRYFVRVYVLDTFLDLKPGESRGTLENAIKGHILQQNSTMAEYER